MDKNVDLDSRYILSKDVVMRDIQGESIIVPIAAGIGDMEDELYTVNDAGKAILSKLDGKSKLQDIVKALIPAFDGDEAVIREDVVGFVSELYRRKILVEAP